MNERTKERNELAKQLYVAQWKDNSAPSLKAAYSMNLADTMMEAMYGHDWDREAEEAEVVKDETETAKPLAVVYGEGGKPMGIRVRTLDVDFALALQDLEGGDSFSYDSAQEKLKELGLRTFNKKEALAVAMYIEEINKAMEEVGGKPFEKDVYVTSELYRPVGCADCNAYYSWFFNGTHGCVDGNDRYYSTFRCRPCLA